MKGSLKQSAVGIAKKIIDGFLAGMLISLGGAVYLACNTSAVLGITPYAKYIGALLFSLALFVICLRGYALYTGKIGLITEKHTKEDISVMLLCLLGNLIATVAFGYLIAAVFPELKETAYNMCTAKLNNQGGLGFSFLRAFLCGILVFLSIDIYRNNKSSLGIFLCIPAFILSGYEHSIADMFYFATSGIASWLSFGFIILIILGNSVGALLIPVLKLVGKKPPEEK